MRGCVIYVCQDCTRDAYRFASLVAFGAGILCVAVFTGFPLIIRPFIASRDAIGDTLGILRVAVPLMLPVSFLSGLFFTLVGAALRNNLGSATETAGALTLTNTAGAALGASIGGFGLLPVFGME